MLHYHETGGDMCFPHLSAQRAKEGGGQDRALVMTENTLGTALPSDPLRPAETWAPSLHSPLVPGLLSEAFGGETASFSAFLKKSPKWYKPAPQNECL